MSIEKDYAASQRLSNAARKQYEALAGKLKREAAAAVSLLAQDILEKRKRGLLKTDSEIEAYAKAAEKKLRIKYESLADKAITETKKVLETQSTFLKKYNKDFDFDKDFRKLKALQEETFFKFRSLSQEATIKVRDILSEGLAKGWTQEKLIRELKASGASMGSKTQIVAVTAEQVFHGRYNRDRAKELGVKKYKYTGTVQRKTKFASGTRLFCRKALEKSIFTDAEIKAIDKGRVAQILPGVTNNWEGKIQGLSVLVCCGGWNCRHQWTFVFD